MVFLETMRKKRRIRKIIKLNEWKKSISLLDPLAEFDVIENPDSFITLFECGTEWLFRTVYSEYKRIMNNVYPLVISESSCEDSESPITIKLYENILYFKTESENIIRNLKDEQDISFGISAYHGGEISDNRLKRIYHETIDKLKAVCSRLNFSAVAFIEMKHRVSKFDNVPPNVLSLVHYSDLILYMFRELERILANICGWLDFVYNLKTDIFVY